MTFLLAAKLGERVVDGFSKKRLALVRSALFEQPLRRSVGRPTQRLDRGVAYLCRGVDEGEGQRAEAQIAGMETADAPECSHNRYAHCGVIPDDRVRLLSRAHRYRHEETTRHGTDDALITARGFGEHVDRVVDDFLSRRTLDSP